MQTSQVNTAGVSLSIQCRFINGRVFLTLMLDDLYAVSLFPDCAGTMWRKFVAEVINVLFAMSVGVNSPGSGTPGNGWPFGNWPKRRGVLLNLQAAVRPQFSSKMIARVRSELDVSTGTCHTVITSRRIGGERFSCVRCQNAADRAVPSRLVDSSIILPDRMRRWQASDGCVFDAS